MKKNVNTGCIVCDDSAPRNDSSSTRRIESGVAVRYVVRNIHTTHS